MGAGCIKEPKLKKNKLPPPLSSRSRNNTTLDQQTSRTKETKESKDSKGLKSKESKCQTERQYNSLKSHPHHSIKLHKTIGFSEHEVLKVIKKHNRECQDQELIENCLTKHFFMGSLDKQARNEIIKEMTLAFIQKNTLVFKQGTIGNFFYILKNGVVELEINGKIIKQMKTGENFGELALIYGAPRSGTIKTITDCFFWVLERKNFRKIVDFITKKQSEENIVFIESTPMLNTMDSSIKLSLASTIYKETFDENVKIIKKNDPSNCMFFLGSGEAECKLDGKLIRKLKPGDYFGEGIFFNKNRAMDVISKTKCICYSISSATLENIFGQDYRPSVMLHFIKAAFQNSKIFNKFNHKLIDQGMFKLFSSKQYKKGEVVLPKGSLKNEKMIILIEGSLVKNNEDDYAIANRGDILFERDLFMNSTSTVDYDVVASPDCILLEAITKEVTNYFGNGFINLMQRGDILKYLQKITLFKTISQHTLNNISQSIHTQTFKGGEKVITQGEEGTRFYIVKKGKIDIYINGDKYIRTITQDDYLGERALLISEPRSATAIANGDVEVFYLEKKDFLSNIEQNLKNHLINRLFLQDNRVELDDLALLNHLGAGSYGDVFLVESRKNKFKYAIKAIQKSKVASESLQDNIQLEKNILLSIDHSFIVKLVKTLKDQYNLYFLMEYVKGKELFDVIRDIGLLNKRQTQFYSASMILAANYLHENKLIFRDFKPENVMVCDNGYIKIIDFGTAKLIEDKTSTVIGTPHYMAPEVILGEGYSFQVDFWSIAICMYEFMCGYVPFGESAEEPMDVYMSIINQNLDFPNYCKDKEFRNLMNQMLNKNPMTRLTKFSEIKGHTWFISYDWKGLISLNVQPAAIPQLKQEDYRDSPRESFSKYIELKNRDCINTKSVPKNIQDFFDGF